MLQWKQPQDLTGFVQLFLLTLRVHCALLIIALQGPKLRRLHLAFASAVFLMGEEVCNAADCTLVLNPFVSAAFHWPLKGTAPPNANLKDSRSIRRA